MRRRFFRPPDLRPPLPPVQRARLDAWVGHLDVDLELAQAMLRLPPAELPPVPGVPDPLVTLQREDEVPTEPPAELYVPPAPEAVRVPPPATKPLRGAYARRANNR